MKTEMMAEMMERIMTMVMRYNELRNKENYIDLPMGISALAGAPMLVAKATAADEPL